ncbi:hypothetical protein B0H13DRAFT_2318787 [Mycena leptocephala]|nr:hypothetical protein B0H13DRAFT_2318787 [Mycena leptocephala]
MVAGPLNSQPPHNSLTGMPTELLHLTVAYLGPSLEVPYKGDWHFPLPQEYHDRSEGLRALSQICQRLRYIFLPMLWESLSIGTNSPKGTRDSAFYRRLGELLKRTSVGLAEEPALLAHIRTVNVILPHYASVGVFPAFARCMGQMPNMHTLQILQAHDTAGMKNLLNKGFTNCIIPAVHTIVLPHPHISSFAAAASTIQRQEVPTSDAYPHVLLTLCEASSALFEKFRNHQPSLYAAVEQLVKMSKSKNTDSGPQVPLEVVDQEDTLRSGQP